MIADWTSYFYPRYRVRITIALALGVIGALASVASIFAAPLEGADALGCPIRALSCEKALTSEFAKLAGIPLGVYGLFYFAFWTLNLRAFQLTSNEGYICFLSWITLLGAVISLALFCVMVFVLRAPCLYCLITHACNLLSFAVLWPVRRWRMASPFTAEQFRHFAALTTIALLAAVALHLGNEVRELKAQIEASKKTLW
jgi:uncharacterized membrane protein